MPPSASERSPLQDAKLSRKDWVLLPLLSLLTIAVMWFAAEFVARQFFSPSDTGVASCLVLDNATTGVRGIPNSICWEKYPETQLVEYKFDCSGYRMDTACGARPPGAFRIALIGSSIAMGERVPVEKTLATLLPNELSQLSGRPVELYNYAMAFGFPRNTVLRFNDVLASKPDLILWILTSVDVKLAGFEYAEFASDSASAPQPGFLGRLKSAVKKTIGNPLAASSTALRHYLQKYQPQDQYIQSYLSIPEGGEGEWDGGPGALRAELSPEWQQHLKKLDGYIADVAKMARTAGVPLVAVMVPNRAQAALISAGHWPDGVDPFRLDQELRTKITAHGGAYIDILPDFRGVPNAERYYLPIDGHPDAAGHALIAGYLAKELAAGAIPELKAAARSSRDSLAQGR